LFNNYYINIKINFEIKEINKAFNNFRNKEVRGATFIMVIYRAVAIDKNGQ